jgi:hypothetical protein
VEYSIFNNNFDKFQMRTDSIIRTEDNVRSVDVDLGNNTILCSTMFDKLRNVKTVYPGHKRDRNRNEFFAR